MECWPESRRIAMVRRLTETGRQNGALSLSLLCIARLWRLNRWCTDLNVDRISLWRADLSNRSRAGALEVSNLMKWFCKARELLFTASQQQLVQQFKFARFRFFVESIKKRSRPIEHKEKLCGTRRTDRIETWMETGSKWKHTLRTIVADVRNP